MRAGCRFACFPSYRAALSLSLVRYCCSNDVIAAVPSVRCFASPSSRHHHLVITPAGMSSPPLAPPYLSRNGEGIRADCGLFGCHRLACLPNAVSRLGRFNSLPSRPVVLVRSCCFACADDECVRSRAVASTASPLERFNRFLKCCRINLLKLYGSSTWLCSTDTGWAFPIPSLRRSILRSASAWSG